MKTKPNTNLGPQSEDQHSQSSTACVLKSSRFSRVLVSLWLGLLLAPTSQLLSQQYQTNLLVNGDAEAGPGSVDGSTVGAIPGWSWGGNFTVVQYGGPSDTSGFPTTVVPGPPERGVNFFAGGPNTSSSSATQVVDLAAFAADIDAGWVGVELSGYLGGYSNQLDSATLTATFRDGSHTPLDNFSVGPVTAADRANATSLLHRQSSSLVPVGARDALLVLQMNRLSAGTYDDGYADNLSFILKAAPQIIQTAVQPPNSLVPLGGSAMLSMTASGAPPLSYQWYFNGSNAIIGATGPSYTIASVHTDDAGAYSVVVSNAYGMATGHVAILTVLLATNYYEECFETAQALDDWHADAGYWEIGVPTTGPGSAHEGTNVAATVLNGTYTDDRQSRLISSPVSIPAADQNPRLRFWHWWSFSLDDYGQVQISTNNGVSWIALSPKYGEGLPGNDYDSSGRWTRAWLDLTPYAGQTVLLGLYFYSNNDGSSSSVDVAPGWYVDEIDIESGPLADFIPSDSFEDAAASDRWIADFGVWEIGVPTSGPGSAHEGSNCLATILSGNYTDDRISRISSRPFIIPPAETNPRLRFWHWWSFSLDDYGQVQISTNNGASWVALSPKYGEGAPGNNYDSSGRWTRAWLDLMPYAGETVLLGLYFYSNNDGSSSSVDVAPGWYVDEMDIESGPLADFIPSDSFEDAAASDRWIADFGVWEIGVPTSGPGSAHSGSNCLATVLSGNYTDNRLSRISSRPFIVPPAETNPRLRFWHWWNFNLDDYGKAQISTDNGTNWIDLATYSASSGPWTQPQLDLVPYAGLTVRLGFYFYSRNNSSSSSVDVNPGWYIDEVRLLHNPALFLVGSPVVRTQDTACVSLAIAVNSPSSGASFVIETPAGNLNNAQLSTDGCWSGTITPQSATQWLVNLQSSCTDGSAGVETIGTICFTAVSAHSAFVPLPVNNLVISNLPPAHAYGTRAVTIANEPLLESWLGPNQDRMATVYGIAGKTYEVRHATAVDGSSAWTPSWTNTMPSSLFYSLPLTGTFSNAPILFLRANEQ